MMEAQNLSRLQQGQTPLLGGENPQLHDSDFSGVTPKNFAAATPHPLAAGATPLPGATPALMGATPSRAIAGTGLLPAKPLFDPSETLMRVVCYRLFQHSVLCQRTTSHVRDS